MADIEPLFADIVDDDIFDFEIAGYIPELERKLKAANIAYRMGGLRRMRLNC